MRIFSTRHGQVAPKEFYKNNPSLPKGNGALTPLGREQALLLSRRLKELNFRGKIFSSPYDRTMETAFIVAKELNLKVTLAECLHEIVSKVDDSFAGPSAEDIKKKYSPYLEEFSLSARWWGEEKEDLFAVIERVKSGLKTIMENAGGEDILLVGHAATSVALRHICGCEDNRGFHWNCHLSLLSSPSGEKYASDCAHLPEEMRTGNSLVYAEQREKLFSGVKNALSIVKGEKKVLHIGDTASAEYGYYKELIELIKPSVIIHTGDLADELKAGRIDGVKEYWKLSAKRIVDIMEKSGARVIIVPGNNDIEDDLKGFVKTAEILPRNEIINFSGKKVLLCHELNKMDETADADVFLYGHGLTGETRSAEDNVRGKKSFFNATWGASLHDFESDKSAIIPKAYL